ncbi:MAG: hypothetical protein IAE99_05825 [Rhodothermales bacterium]|nr:hypothetical protein [Rhodothermales bacterium]
MLTDSLRGVMVAEGVEPFQATTSKLAQLLVQSRASRGAYGVSKFIAFTLLGLLLVLRAYQPAPTWVTPDVLRGAHGLARGAGVLLDSRLSGARRSMAVGQRRPPRQCAFQRSSRRRRQQRGTYRGRCGVAEGLYCLFRIPSWDFSSAC